MDLKVITGLLSFLKALGEHSFSFLFQCQEATHISGPCFLSTFYFQCQQWTVKSFSRHIILSLTPLPPSYAFKDTCDHIGPNRYPGLSPYFKVS